MRLSGNTILITGGTSGIGLGFAGEFLKRNNKVIICGRREDRLREIKQKNNLIETIPCDISDLTQRENLVEKVIKSYPDVNVLINNAGIQLLADLANVNLEKVHREIETNFTAPIHLTSLFVQHLKSKNESAVINISSGLAFVPIPAVSIYCATKAAIHSITMSLRYQLKNTPVKVFEIIPPSVDTELGSERRKDKNQTHGGISISEFVSEALEAIENDKFEAAIDGAKNLYEKREALFSVINRSLIQSSK